MESKPTDKTMALFIDGENIAAKYMEEILDKTKQYGNLIIKRIYANWSNPNTSSWHESIHNYSLIPIQHFPIAAKKNSIDIKMSVDIMDVFYTKTIDVFVIASSDGDYTALVQSLIEKGKTIIGIGESKAIQAYQKSFSIPFICFDPILKTKKSNQAHDKQEIPPTLANRVLTIVRDRLKLNEGEYLSLQKLAIQKEIPDFNPKKYVGCKTLSAFIEKIIKVGKVKDFELYRTDANQLRLRKK